MALIGMTGFGRSEGVSGDVAWAWEVRSVNGRNLEVRVRTPQGAEAWEAKAREEAQKRFRRGNIQITLATRREGAPLVAPAVNQALAEALIAAGEAHVAAGRVRPASWGEILSVRGVVEFAETVEDEAVKAAREAALADGLAAALDACAQARRAEGAALTGVLGGLVDRIAEIAAQAEAPAAALPGAIKARIEARLAELLESPPVDPQRIAQEAAALALKADVREELDRLAAHVAEARKLLANGEGAGRRLDFLAQEFHREANTLGSKSAVPALTQASLALKALIDQLKEQAANVE
jgi:uncharacterized protein (TIGR00255 family)